VVGLTTALELRTRHPAAQISIAAKYLPGDSAPDYTSAWGGANWFPASTDNETHQDWDSITYRKFGVLATERPESGLLSMRIRFHYEKPIGEVGILTASTRQLWFEDLVGGFETIPQHELPAGTVFGLEMNSFVIDVQRYLPWLQAECTRHGIHIYRKVFYSIREALDFAPKATTVFNCTGIGAMTLGGVCDQKMYPARGQILLVEGPEKPLKKMYFRAPDRDGEATHVFPRGEGRQGVILGGCRQKGNWNGEPELEFAKIIKARCCALVPELGRPEDLRVVKHGVGLRRESTPLSSNSAASDSLTISSWTRRRRKGRSGEIWRSTCDPQLWCRRDRLSGFMVSIMALTVTQRTDMWCH
jgi:D-amino-acid oxidase